ncbi:hypothetical protein DNTS_025178 [Danionella cerebrum]|uniref:RRM domain-containing protein n=1 Tax=Danionella cerebrum TaxID=2873325 RepID=A0A553QC97_9TELE|nr:hypothetical protein DNTS_025178 [Danionella translucida]
MSNGRIYVGNLPVDVQERDIEDLFYKYGKIQEIELKNNRGTIPFAFIRFEDPRDAEDAVFGRNGYGFGNSKLRVEYPRSTGSKFSGPSGGGPRGRFGPPSRRSEFRVAVMGLAKLKDKNNIKCQEVKKWGQKMPKQQLKTEIKKQSSPSSENMNISFFSNKKLLLLCKIRALRNLADGMILNGTQWKEKRLPPTGSWQDLKDHMREAGDVCFADVQKDGEGVVEFLRREDMEYALRRLNGTEFRSHQGETSFIQVMMDRGTSWGRSRSRSRSPRGRYSPPYQSRGSPPPRYRSSPPPRRAPLHHSPPPSRHYR